MTEKERVYDRLCFTLTEYEQSESSLFRDCSWEETLYEMLVDIQRNWELITTTE